MHTLSKRITRAFTLESSPLSTLRSGLVGACTLMVCLFAGTAEANCQTFLAQYFNWAVQPPHRVTFTYFSMQGDGRASFVKTTWEISGSMEYNHTTGNLETSGIVPVLYSDREVSGQPFPITVADSSDILMTPAGNVTLFSNTWGSTVYLTNMVCENNLMYGWGTPIGVYSHPALYVFQFGMMSVID